MLNPLYIFKSSPEVSNFVYKQTRHRYFQFKIGILMCLLMIAGIIYDAYNQYLWIEFGCDAVNIAKAAFINLNDMDLYMLLKRTDSFIRNWEMVTANRIILQGQASYANYLAGLRQASQNPSQPSVQREIGDNYGENGYQTTSAQSYQRGNAYPADRGNGNYRDNGYQTSSAQSYQRGGTYSDNGNGYYGR